MVFLMKLLKLGTTSCFTLMLHVPDSSLVRVDEISVISFELLRLKDGDARDI